MSIVLGTRSLQRLAPLHPDLVRVVKRAAAISNIDFTVLEGMRTFARQKQLLAEGATTTMRSRHLTGHAVDLGVVLNRAISWHWPLYNKLAEIIKQAAHDEKVPIEWGGDWKTFKDGPHWQLPWEEYP